MRQDPARRQEATDEAGSEPNGDFHDPDLFPRRLRVDLSARHHEPPGRAGQVHVQVFIKR